ncbi:hypothetical protein FSARC_2955 [Fusarium sarcochroum]|uniref:Nucleoside phosphorylase domain-containing protein n=1 Tax=Fusarium sarcochroum TaxID=1208366 RepID=A0A8H4U516_9HYPO|nr:hypothetical protein FSARC_2955 [Fusarium sarcochroum]
MLSLKSAKLYTIAWIATLPLERQAAMALLDEEHSAPEDIEQQLDQAEDYAWGRVGKHNIVIASLSGGLYGPQAAPETVGNLIRLLPHIQIGLVVGVGGGIARPDEGQDIRLGDVIVSQPDGTSKGLVQCDLNKMGSKSTYEQMTTPKDPPLVLLQAVSKLREKHDQTPSKIPDLLRGMMRGDPRGSSAQCSFVHPGSASDRLFKSQHDHIGHAGNCDHCHPSLEVSRGQRRSMNPTIHYGLIASVNKVIKDAAVRDVILEDTGYRCLCVEMEAAGIMSQLPCLVVRGVSDYADSHKNDLWQPYAAATAAAFVVELLEHVQAM